MRVEALTFLNDSKETITIVVETLDSYSSKGLIFRIADVLVKPFRKQKQLSISHQISDDYKFRNTEYSERDKYKLDEYLKYCTKEQMQEALIKAWESIKPDVNNINVF